MKTISIEESKGIQLEILQSLHDFCGINDLRYSLYSGTLLGAVRHHGFIPWDDDIDVLMPRADYNKFISSYCDTKGYYKLHSIENDPTYSIPFAKIEDVRTILKEHTTAKDLGVYIDIFPCDYVGDSKESAVSFVKDLNFLKLLYMAKLIKPTKRNSCIKRIGICFLKTILFFHPTRFFAVRISKLAQRHHLPTNFSADVVFGYGVKEIIPSDIFDKRILLAFEGRYFYSMAKYDIYLKSVFGNYMELPPIDKRVSRHTIDDIFWK